METEKNVTIKEGGEEEIEFDNEKEGKERLNFLTENLKRIENEVFLLKKALKSKEDVYKGFEKEIVIELEKLGLFGIKNDFGAFEKKERKFASVKEENNEILKIWLREIGLDFIIKETVSSSSLSSNVAQMIKAGEEIPNFINIWTKKTIKIKKTRKEGTTSNEQ